MKKTSLIAALVIFIINIFLMNLVVIGQTQDSQTQPNINVKQSSQSPVVVPEPKKK